MTIVIESNELINKLLPKTNISNIMEYRHFKYIYSISMENGCLLLNTLTRQLIFLTHSEQCQYENLVFYDSILKKFLVENFYIVDKAFDDYRIAKQIKEMLPLFNNKKGYIDSFTILTTSDCNARCFYCYEKGCSHINMDNTTANAVADYIITKSNGHPVRINWFGGEPLYNAQVIDIISSKLHENSIEFISNMISNGLLFDKSIISRAVNSWNLKNVQITLDGTEKVYNKVKSYIDASNINPFNRVIENIKMLLNSGITVKIRLNMDLYNYDDLVNLVDYLAISFVDKSNIQIYPAIIYDYNQKRTLQENQRIINLFFKLSNKVDNNGMLMKSYYNNKIKHNYCMADSNTSTLISPIGKLGRCEHYFEEYIWGSVNNDHTDFSVLNDWKKYYSDTSYCKNCLLFPICLRLKNCPNLSSDCNEEYREYKLLLLEYSVRNTYLKYQKNSNQDIQ